jgi:RNA polymerase sigma factor (sigma-70 family)
MEHIVAPGAQWPDRLRLLCLRCGPAACAGGPASQDDRGHAWVALRDALVRFLRIQARRFGGASKEDLEDLASAKALELLVRSESGEWRIEDRSGAEVAGYLSTVARNALIDLMKRRSRIVPQAYPGDDSSSAESDPDPAIAVITAHADAPAMALEFVDSLRDCVASLQPRARTVWFFRAFYAMSSRTIAQHPAVRLQPAHVDVIVQRARSTIRSCMNAKGFEVADMPAGSFVALWEYLESLRADVPEVVEARVQAR